MEKIEWKQIFGPSRFGKTLFSVGNEDIVYEINLGHVYSNLVYMNDSGRWMLYSDELVIHGFQLNCSDATLKPRKMDLEDATKSANRILKSRLENSIERFKRALKCLGKNKKK